MNRIEFLKSSMVSLAPPSLHGCITKQLYKGNETAYEETSQSFLITEDGSKFVVLGRSYHYIFHDVTPSLEPVLTSPFRQAVAVSLSDFYVRGDNVVTGGYTVAFVAEASDQDRRLASDAGFVPFGQGVEGETPGLMLSGHLEGARYSYQAGGVRVRQQTTHRNLIRYTQARVRPGAVGR